MEHRNSIDYNKLSKMLSQALRHTPKEYGIVLDEEGWVEIDLLISGIRYKGGKLYEFVSLSDIELVIQISEKKRLEISSSKLYVRALYGHSRNIELSKQEQDRPFDYLYHGTTSEAFRSIKEEGLKPMNRKFVHYSTDEETAILVGKRKTATPKILKINALNAYEDGIAFYKGNDTTWLSECLPASYIVSE